MAYDVLPSKAAIDRALEGLKARGVGVRLVADRKAALEELKKMIPAGDGVMTAGSTTLEQIGFTDILKTGQHPWHNLKDAILAEKDPVKQGQLRRTSCMADHFIGSVHALTEDGRTITASYSGSQIPAYSFLSNHAIWVVGAQKIVPDLEEGMKRVREYCLPLEDKRVKSTGGAGSDIGWLLVFERQHLPFRKIDLILVNEVLGF